MQIITLIKNQLKLLFDNRIAIFAIIAAPLLLTFLFSFSLNSNGKTNLYAADLDNSKYSKELISLIEKHKDINLVLTTEDKIKEKVDDSTYPMGLVIDKNFGNNIMSGKSDGLKIIENFDNEDAAMLTEVITTEAGNLKKLSFDSDYISKNLGTDKSTLTNNLFKEADKASTLSIYDKTLKSGQKTEDKVAVTLIGFLSMFIWFVVIQGFRTLIQEKENNTSNRILSTPTNYTKYLISKIAATFILGLIVVAVILIAGKYIFKVSIVTNIFSEAIIFALYIFAIIGIVMLFVPFIKKQQSFTMIGAVLMAFTGILGGAFFSIDEMAPKIMQIISKLMPESWAIRSLKDVIFNNAGLSSQLTTIIIFVSIGTAGLIISSVLSNIKIKAEESL